LTTSSGDSSKTRASSSVLAAPAVNPEFRKALDDLVSVAGQGHRPDSEFFNPSNLWIMGRIRLLQDLSTQEREQVLRESRELAQAAQEANAAGRAAQRAWPDAAIRLDNGGVTFFSQLGVARRPDLTQYFIDGFSRNRDSLAFSESNQALFAEVFTAITERMKQHFSSGDTVVQSDRQLGDAPGRSFHARQLMFGTHYMQLPYMWRQLTFELPEANRSGVPDVMEVTIPHWLDDLGLSEQLKEQIREAGLTQLVFKAPTKGLSLHLGFDYVGEHKMGPLTIAMFKVRQAQGLAVQAALSVSRTRNQDGSMTNAALVTVGPSLHGKSTLTIMIDMSNSDLSRLLGLSADAEEGVYPMNDDIVLLQPLPKAIETVRDGRTITISHSIDGTENNFYAVPSGLTKGDDPITYDVVRGTADEPNSQETLENVLADPETGAPDYLQNPVRNMRMVLSRSRLLARKGVAHLLRSVTNGRVEESVHVPMEEMDKVLWQGVMRQNTVIPPLVRLTCEQYVRSLMFGEAVQTGAATGAIGRPYVEYFSDPFIIGLEDENANALLRILQSLERGGLPQEYYMFNTGGVGAEANQEASGPRYKKISRELTLTLQEALLRGAARFEYDETLGVDVAVSIENANGQQVMDLRQEWLPSTIYGVAEYAERVKALKRRRYYGDNAEDKAGILRYTKATDAIFDFDDIPAPSGERELACLVSFYWHVDQAYPGLTELVQHLGEGEMPAPHLMHQLQEKYESGVAEGLSLTAESTGLLEALGLSAQG
jgi:ATP-dependent phosphoenolpyruvate carboxykinase